jgi:hypothetical protein
VVAADGQVRDDALVVARDAAPVLEEADPADGVGLCHVEPSVVQVEAVGTLEPVDERPPLVGASVAVRISGQPVHGAVRGCADEQVSLRSEAEEAGRQVPGVDVDREAGRESHARPEVLDGRWVDTATKQQVAERSVDGKAFGEQDAGSHQQDRDHQGRDNTPHGI